MVDLLESPERAALGRLVTDNRPAAWGLFGVMVLRDPDLAVHSVRGTRVSLALARTAQVEIDTPVAWGFLLHDIGSLELPLELLRSARTFTADDRRVLSDHPLRSAQIVAEVPGLADAVSVVLHHHEHWDGSGYPHGLHGTETPLAARVLAVGDAFAALTAPRPHRPAQDPEAAAAIIVDEAGAQFDPEIAVLLEGMASAFPPDLRHPPDTATLLRALGSRFEMHVERAQDLATAQLQTLFAAALGLEAAEAAKRLGRAPGTQRTWAASLRRSLACPPRVSLSRFLSHVGSHAFRTLTDDPWRRSLRDTGS